MKALQLLNAKAKMLADVISVRSCVVYVHACEKHERRKVGSCD